MTGSEAVLRYSRAAAHAAADRGRHQRAPGVSVLPAHLLVLLLAEAPLPGQARAVGHAVRVRVLSPPLPHQELAHDTQESAASRLQRHAQAAAEDFSPAECARAGPAPSVRAGWRARATTAAGSTMTADHRLTASEWRPRLPCAILRTMPNGRAR